MTFNLTFWLVIAIIFSIGINISVIWYTRTLLERFLFISNNLGDLVEVLVNYEKHLKQVYKMDMFYGDETLQYLMSHTSSLLEILEDYKDVYDIALPLEEEEETIEEKEEDSQEQQEELFYAGTRKRDN